MSCRLSVIVPAFNAEEFIAAALCSVFAQRVDDLEILVIDDGSCDSTAVIVERMIPEAPAGKELRLLRQASNGGLASARNAGLAAARGDYVALLDADDVFEDHALARLLAALESEPAASAVFPNYRWMSQDGVDFGHESPFPTEPVSAATIILDNPIHADSGVLARRESLLAVSPFDENLTGYIGADMWIRFAIRHGAGSLLPVPKACVRYRRHEAQITSDWRRMDRNWHKLLQKLDAEFPDVIRPIRKRAIARHRVFCADIAYKYGDYAEAREFMARAMLREPLTVLRNGDARMRLMACIASLLPAQLHKSLRARFG